MIEWIAAAGVAFAAVVLACLSARRSGAKDEATANKAKEADAYETQLKDTAAAVDARNRIDPDRMPDNDRHRRD